MSRALAAYLWMRMDEAEKAEASGLIPAYTLLDWSGAVRLAHERAVTFGINNVTDVPYFTKRTAEYPGPGILPGIGRSLYFGLKAAF